jgi:hypothetical protein
MPATKRPKPIYQRGDFRLYARAGRNHEIVWYDEAGKRERSISAGTVDDEAASKKLDQEYRARTKGEKFCPTCGERIKRDGVYVTAAIADYLEVKAGKPSIDAMTTRLGHVLTYLVESGQATAKCAQIDENWVQVFRDWMAPRPIVSSKGAERTRAVSTVENSVLQLAAAINESGGVEAQFKAMQPKEVNETPTHREDVPGLTRMFRYCLYPAGPTARSPKEIERRKRERSRLLSFLRISVATMARPDAAHDVSTLPARKQWDKKHKILNLNPTGRRQTKKFRATVPMARQMMPIMNACSGPLIPTESVENAWVSMEKALGLPGNGQSGMKLIRRSMGNIVRLALPLEAHQEVSLFMGHDKFDDTTDLYAPFSPTYLRRALAVIEDVIDEIESGCPGAFESGAYRDVTAHGGNVVSLGSVK